MWQHFLASKLIVLLSGLTAGAVTAPFLSRATRPLVRQLLKGGILARREIMRITEGLREELQDLTAEAKSELGEEPAPHEHAHAGAHDQGPNPPSAQARS
jgi:hypothetical protein